MVSYGQTELKIVDVGVGSTCPSPNYFCVQFNKRDIGSRRKKQTFLFQNPGE